MSFCIDQLHVSHNQYKAIVTYEVDEINVWLDWTIQLRDHIIDGKSGKTKSRCLIQAWKRCDAPFQDFLWLQLRQLLVDELEMGSRKVHLWQTST